jgi:hypothetical protein
LRRIAAATPATPIVSSTTSRAVGRGRIREREKDGSGTIGLLSSPAAPSGSPIRKTIRR